MVKLLVIAMFAKCVNRGVRVNYLTTQTCSARIYSGDHKLAWVLSWEITHRGPHQNYLGIHVCQPIGAFLFVIIYTSAWVIVLISTLLLFVVRDAISL